MRFARLLFIFLLPLLSLGQNDFTVCDSLMIKRQFNAAADCLEELHSENPIGPAYQKLIEAYLILADTGKVFKLARKQSKVYGQSKPAYYVDYWHFSRTLGRRGPDFSVLENLTRSNPFSVRASAQQLEKYNYIEEAIELYQIYQFPLRRLLSRHLLVREEAWTKPSEKQERCPKWLLRNNLILSYLNL